MRNIALLTSLLLALPTIIVAQESDNQLDINLQMLEHGEMRIGGISPTNEEETYAPKNAYFLMSRTRLNIDYKRSGPRPLCLTVCVSPSHGFQQSRQSSFADIYDVTVQTSQ